MFRPSGQTYCQKEFQKVYRHFCLFFFPIICRETISSASFLRVAIFEISVKQEYAVTPMETKRHKCLWKIRNEEGFQIITWRKPIKTATVYFKGISYITLVMVTVGMTVQSALSDGPHRMSWGIEFRSIWQSKFRING